MSAESPAAAAVRRSNQVYFQQASRCEPLDCGYAYYSPEYPGLPSCNFVGEVVLAGARNDPWRRVEGFFAEKGLTCYQWVPARDQPDEALSRLLAPHGFERRETVALLLPPEVEVRAAEGFRILGARAMRRAYARVVAARSGEVPELAGQLSAVHLERLNDPQYDGFVALLADEPVGMVTVFQVGRIGRICDLYVLRGRRRQGVGTALFRHAVRTARRWALEPICAEVSAENVIGRALYAKVGFQEGGTIVRFCRPGTPQLPEW